MVPRGLHLVARCVQCQDQGIALKNNGQGTGPVTIVMLGQLMMQIEVFPQVN